MDNNKGFVYFIYDPISVCIKIGYSMADPYIRMASLQTGNPNRLYMIGYITQSEHNNITEKHLHNKYEKHKCEGGSEWFYASEIIIQDIINILESGRQYDYKVINLFIYSFAKVRKFITPGFVRNVLGLKISNKPREDDEFILSKYYLSGDSMGASTKYYIDPAELENILSIDGYHESLHKFGVKKPC